MSAREAGDSPGGFASPCEYLSTGHERLPYPPSPAPRARYYSSRPNLGLAPQALCHRPLRGLSHINTPHKRTLLTINAPEGGGPAWVQYEFAQPFTARAISIAGRGGIPVGRVLAGDNGADFRTLVTLPGPQLYRGGWVRTFDFLCRWLDGTERVG